MDSCDIHNKEMEKQTRRLKRAARALTLGLVGVGLIIMVCVVAFMVIFASKAVSV